jgi:predicted DNA-binding protein (MmcQ/YjbR family)
MDVEDFRDYCLSFKEVREEMPWTDSSDEYNKGLLCFYVFDKWFCFANIEVFDFCDLKCEPSKGEDLRSRYMGIKEGWHMNKKHWISVYFNQDVPDHIIKELIRESYDIVVSSLTKSQKELLQK